MRNKKLRRVVKHDPSPKITLAVIRKSTIHADLKTILKKKKTVAVSNPLTMAAYATLVSLINIMEQIKIHPRLSFAFDNKQIESLGEKICFLLGFIEAGSRGGKAEADLEGQILSVAYEAEDVIESHVVDQIHAAAAGSIISLLDLQTIMEGMDCIMENVNKFKQGKRTYSMHAASSSQPPMSATNSAMIGFDDELIQLMEVLVGREKSRQIIPIHGMGGIGKTTLARNTYENPTIVNHFDIQAWVTVSQNYTAKAILLELLNSCQSRSPGLTDAEDYRLGEKLHKILSGRRYLIILDDVWSVEAWEKIMFFFPDNNNRSRMVVTTRLSNVAAHFGSSCLPMNLLNEEKSWNLFREKAFGKVISSTRLEKIGKAIANKCKGLPLSLTVIGRLLGNSSMTEEYWENVADDINSILNSGDDGDCLSILSLSYTHLPAHLKPCFLYMGVFPEDHDIRVTGLIKLWVAEGFLKPNETQSPEEIAKSYVTDLVGRNLLLARQWGVSGKLKTCKVHDLLRDLCLRIIEKEKFLRVVNSPNNIPAGDMTMDRRIVLNDYRPQDLVPLQSATLARSLTCRVCWKAPFKFRLLRVLDEVDRDYPKILSQQVNLRYLAVRLIHTQELSSSIFLLWNLQTLISTTSDYVAGLEIWEMTQLRHLVFPMIYLPDPPSSRRHGSVLRNLQTLKTLVDMRLSEELCRRIPNVKRLGLTYSHEFQGGYDCLSSLYLLDKLERLSLFFMSVPNRDDLLRGLKLPSSLQKLTLENCELGWEDLRVIGSLPNLEVLQLRCDSVQGSEWNPVEGQFLGLKYLRIVVCDTLVSWNADGFHFPVLETLYLKGLSELEEIPSGIGEIPTLRLIHSVQCSESCAISALEILDEQESQGYEGLRVRLDFWNSSEMDSFKERVEPQSSNVQLGVHLD